MSIRWSNWTTRRLCFLLYSCNCFTHGSMPLLSFLKLASDERVESPENEVKINSNFVRYSQDLNLQRWVRLWQPQSSPALPLTYVSLSIAVVDQWLGIGTISDGGRGRKWCALRIKRLWLWHCILSFAISCSAKSISVPFRSLDHYWSKYRPSTQCSVSV